MIITKFTQEKSLGVMIRYLENQSLNSEIFSYMNIDCLILLFVEAINDNYSRRLGGRGFELCY